MKVSYEIIEARPDVEWIQVRFFNDAGQEFWKNIPHVDWSPEGVREMIESFGPEIAAFWERTANVDNQRAMASIQTVGEFECEPEDFWVRMPPPPVIRDEPEFDPFTQRIEPREHEVGDEFIEWDVIELTPEEQAQFLDLATQSATGERNHWLMMSDWIFTPDSSPEDMDAWLEYRQALRDLPEQEGWPKVINWPVRPNER